MTQSALDTLLAEIRACRLCADHLPQEPRPLVTACSSAKILIIGQAPGSKAHASRIGWDDDSGDRLRGWLGLDRKTFYDAQLIAQMPSGFCYPGKSVGGDLPPRPECAPRWHDPLRNVLPKIQLTLLVGRHAQKRYLPQEFAPNMTEAVRRWREAPDGYLPLPHPAWRSRIWIARNPWFEADLLPDLQARIAQITASGGDAR